MKLQLLWLFTLAAAFVGLARGQAQDATRPTPIVLSEKAAPVERAAADDLSRGLGKIYRGEKFPVGTRLPDAGRCIILKSERGQAVPAPAESFVVANTNDGRRELGIITGADPRGTAYGVYALLEKLGYGFYLSYDASPPARTGPFSFAEWNFSDRPLTPTRLVFNWHNFLSGCSTWNLPDWQRWITQSHKMGYNAVMVHAYGNNPMASFEFNGRKKPAGFLSTTVKGRDWSTAHVNDVRRLWGGSVFDGPIFGAEAALVPDEQRTEAARELMRGAFACAASNAMDVYFAYDVDTPSANPHDLILTLSPEARFPVQAGRQIWLANPETPEGYRYYKTQAQALVSAYPQITCLVVWFRAGGTPWTEMKVSEMPAAWQQEYAAELAKTPAVAKLWHAPQMFALGKIVRAFARALEEVGTNKVQLASGTWRFDFLAPCDRFFPTNVALIGLDYQVLHDQAQLRDAASRQVLREVGAHRRVIPVIWAHHDDGNYIGRPYTPFSDFSSKLRDANTSGFGIIHWTTRPLDLFFTSHIKQVWQSTENQPLRATCEDMAARSFGANSRQTMGEYLERWVTEAPKFARETSDYFIDRQLTNVEQVVRGCAERLNLINTENPTIPRRAELDRIRYFLGLEFFIKDFHETQEIFQRAQGLLKSGDIPGAKATMTQCQPEKIIEQFARFSAAAQPEASPFLGGITRGEQGLVVSMNLRWLPHFARLRQALGLEGVRYKFGLVSRDPLAQNAGSFTYHFDSERNVWQCLDLESAGVSSFALPASTKIIPSKEMPASFAEICRGGIESAAPLKFTVRPILGSLGRGQGQGLRLAPGSYRLKLLMVDPASTAAGERVFTVSIKGTDSGGVQEEVDIFKITGQAGQVVERTYPVRVGPAGEVEVTLTPARGKAILCGAALERERQNGE